MPDDSKTYLLNGSTYDIPSDKTPDFLKDNPNAVEAKSFVQGKDTFDIPIDKVDAFLKDNPTAAPLKKKDNSEVTTTDGNNGVKAGVGETPSTKNKDFVSSVIDNVQKARSNDVSADDSKVNKSLIDYTPPTTPSDKAKQVTDNPQPFQSDLQDNILGQTSNPKMKSLYDAFNTQLKTNDYYDKPVPFTNAAGTMQLAADDKGQAATDKWLETMKNAKGNDGEPLLDNAEYNA